MNFKNKVIILGSIILVLVSLIIIAPFTDGTAKVDRGDSQTLFGRHFKSSLASQITLSNSEEEVILIKEDNKWLVNYNGNLFPADSQQVLSFLDEFKKLTTGRQVEKSTKDFAAYGVSDEAAIRVEIIDAKSNTFILLIGDEDSTYTKRFYRLENSEAIYETGIPTTFTQLGDREWSDLKLFPGIEDAQNVISLSLTGQSPLDASSEGHLDYQLVLQTNAEGASAWIFGTDSEAQVNQYEAGNLARKISTATAYTPVFDLESTITGLETPAVTLSITGADGNIRTLLVGNKVPEEDRYYCEVAETQSHFALSQSVLTGLLQSKTSLTEVAQ